MVLWLPKMSLQSWADLPCLSKQLWVSIQHLATLHIQLQVRGHKQYAAMPTQQLLVRAHQFLQQL